MGAGLVLLAWLCPFWYGPTPAVYPLLWGGSCLALIAITTKPTNKALLSPLFLVLLTSLGLMIAWRSNSSANAVAAGLCLMSIGLSAQWAANISEQDFTSVIAWGWLFAGVVNAVLGLLQYFGFTQEASSVAFGFLRQRNQLASLCNLALLALLYLWHLKRLSTPLTTVCAGVLVAALAATCSRAGALQLFTLSLTLIWIALGKRTSPATQHQIRAALVFVLLTYTFCAWLLPTISGAPESVASRVMSMASNSGLPLQDSRRVLWDNTLTLIQQSPLLGHGWRELAYALRMSDFGDAIRFDEQADHAHNLPLQLAAELGLPFTVLWFCAIVWLVLRYKPWATRAPSQALGWGVLLIITIHSLLEYPLWYAPFQMATGFACGLLFKQAVPQAAANLVVQHGGLTGQYPQTLQRIFGGFLLIFCLYAAFDYHRVTQLFVPPAERSQLYQNQTLAHAEKSWLFANQVLYAKLIITPITESSAHEQYQRAKQVLHFSPEPNVFKLLIATGSRLEKTDPIVAAELLLYKQRLRLIEGP